MQAKVLEFVKYSIIGIIMHPVILLILYTTRSMEEYARIRFLL